MFKVLIGTSCGTPRSASGEPVQDSKEWTEHRPQGQDRPRWSGRKIRRHGEGGPQGTHHRDERPSGPPPRRVVTVPDGEVVPTAAAVMARVRERAVPPSRAAFTGRRQTDTGDVNRPAPRGVTGPVCEHYRAWLRSRPKVQAAETRVPLPGEAPADPQGSRRGFVVVCGKARR